jgi:hypothetical protein
MVFLRRAGLPLTRLRTVIDGEVLDESHLHGIIAQFQTLGITLVSVHPVP